MLTPARASILAGRIQTYHAEGFTAAGRDLGDFAAQTSFSIRPDGSCTGAACTATKAGWHTVVGTVSDTGVSATAALLVLPGPLAHLDLIPPNASMTAGGRQTYTAVGADRYGNGLGDVTGRTTFTIAPDGSCTGAACTATKAGWHTVVGTVSDTGVRGRARLLVRPGPLALLTLEPGEASIGAGGSVTYRAEGTDKYYNLLDGITARSSFKIDPDGSCTRNSCTATRIGRHTVTGTVLGTGVSATARLEVLPGPLARLELQPGAASIAAGASQTYLAGGFDASGRSLGEFTTITRFTISPDGSCSRATCTATVAGPHRVTGTVIHTNVGTEAQLDVLPGPLARLVLRPPKASIGAGGGQSYLSLSQGLDGQLRMGDPASAGCLGGRALPTPIL